MKIFIQNIVDRKFFAGDSRWSENPAEAYPFPNAIAALNFAAVCPDREKLMMHFEAPEALRHRPRKAKRIKAKFITLWQEFFCPDRPTILSPRLQFIRDQ